MPAFPEPPTDATVPVIWYVMGTTDSGPAGLAAEPGAASVDIPDDVLEWALANGVDTDPDVYLLVTTETNPGWPGRTLASREGAVSAGDGARIDDARAQHEAANRETRELQQRPPAAARHPRSSGETHGAC